MPASRWSTRAAATITVVVLTVAVPVLPAAAHTQLIDTAPGDAASVEQPIAAVVLRFDHPPLEPVAETTTITVSAPSGADVGGEVVAAAPQQLAEPIPVLVQEDGEWVRDYHFDAYPLRVPLADLPQEGEYTVAYSVPDDDGHPTEGSFRFTYAGPTGPVPESAAEPTPGDPLVPTASAEEAAAANPDAATPAAEPDTAAEDPASDGTRGSATGPIAASVAAVLVLAAGGLLAWRRGRAPSAAPDPPAGKAAARPRSGARGRNGSRRRRSASPAATSRRSPSAKRPR